MSKPISIWIHPSQYPDAVRMELIRSLKERSVNHKFHYESYKQVAKWLELHEQYSPARKDPDCLSIYDQAYASVAESLPAEVQLIGLGAGGGQKDRQLLQMLRERGKKAHYTPLDVSGPMVVTAALATRIDAATEPTPIVADLGIANDLQALINQVVGTGERIYTFFGMIPNFHPELVLPRLHQLLRPRDILLISANLAPGQDYRKGVAMILPQYQNQLTQDWLMMFLRDLGIDREDGELRWNVEGERFLRVAAHFHFAREREISAAGERFHFSPADRLGLFFSYRYSIGVFRELLAQNNFELSSQWITTSEEEGVFVCRKK
jgi:L-histidine N-alpha-methyltransferase